MVLTYISALVGLLCRIIIKNEFNDSIWEHNDEKNIKQEEAVQE